jgi:hypothetical protein
MSKIATQFECTIRTIKNFDKATGYVTAVRDEDGEVREYHIDDLRHPDGINGIYAELKDAGLAA